MSRMRQLMPWMLGLALLALLVGWFLYTHKLVDKVTPLPPRGEASYNPLYALKLALRAQDLQVDSRQRLRLGEVALAGGDTVVIYSDPRALRETELDGLFAFAEAGGHLVLRLPDWSGNADTTDAHMLAAYLPIRPLLLPPRCMSLHVPDEEPHVEFCRGARFLLQEDAEAGTAWFTEQGQHVFARFPYGDGSVDLVSELDILGNDELREGPHLLFARQLLAPNWDRGTVHLVYAADMPPLWRWLLDNAWMALLPMLLGLLAWLWMRAQRFGPLLPAPLQPRRSLLEHVAASGEHLVRYGKLGLLHRAMRDAVLARLRRRDALAAAMQGDTQAALLAPRLGIDAASIRGTLDTRPPATLAELRHRITRLVSLRKRL